MKLSVFRDSYEIETVADLRPHLSFRHDEHYASFWLSTDSETDPSHLASSSIVIARLPSTSANQVIPATIPMARTLVTKPWTS